MLHIHVIKLFTSGVLGGHKLAHKWLFTFGKTEKKKKKTKQQQQVLKHNGLN